MKAARAAAAQAWASGRFGRLTLRLGERTLVAAAAATLALVVLASVLRPVVPWDSWAYHLPFSALLWDIGDATHTFVLADQLVIRFAGFPLFAEFLQGALWKASGSMAATTLINSVALAALLVAVGRVVRGSFPIMAFGSLSIPLIAFHATSNYIDLFVAVAICLQALAAWQIERQTVQAPARPDRRATTGWSGLFTLAAAAAGNAKFQSLVVSVAISVFLAGYLLARRSRLGKGTLTRAALVLILATTLSLATAARNTFVFSNPVYPVIIELPSLGVTLPGLEGEYRSHPTYAESLGRLARPIYWMASITEIDWTIRQAPAVYNIDSNGGDHARRFGPGRTGGYWGVFIVGCGLLTLGLLILASRRHPADLAADGFILLLFAFLTVVTAFMPQSHELRYYLYWPILLLLVICVLARSARLSSAARVGLSLIFVPVFLTSQAMIGFPLRPWPAQPTAEVALRNSPEVAFARRTGGICLGPQYNPLQLAYSAVFHGGSYVVAQGWQIEQGWQSCGQYPAYPP